MNQRAYLFMLVALGVCLIAAEKGPTDKRVFTTGIEGVITEGPIHGGPSRADVPDSRPLTNTEFIVKQKESTVTSFKTDSAGRFRIPLEAGHYAVSKKVRKGHIGNYGPFEVDVVAGKVTKVQWECDTGMR